MKNAITTIKSELKQAAQQAFGDELKDIDPSVNPASNPSFGDFQSNVAMTLSKQLKLAPRAIAEQIVAKLNGSEIYEAPSIAGAGFINIKLKRSFLESQINSIKNDPERLKRGGVSKVAEPRTVVVDMSSPNIAKEMHVGHLRSTIIGDAIARTFDFVGHNVIKVNHVGDWGTQFGMLIAELKEQFPTALTESHALDLGDLVDFYKKSKKHFDEDAEFKARAHQEVVSLQSGAADSLKAWKLLCNQSRKAFDQIYKTLNIENLEERGESFYNEMLQSTVDELMSKGVAVENQGAKCVFLDGFLNEEGNALPLIVQKKDGGFNYAATDVAAVRHRVEQDRADEIVYVVGAEQSLHLQMMLLTAKKAGWLPETVRTTHVGFGSVLGDDGKKLKTRSGETVRLRDLLVEAMQHAREEIDARFAEKERKESDEFKENVSQMVGIGAVKYADLSLNRMTNYHFSFKKMLSLQGNTAPYMMYAYVRVRGISREGGIDFEKLDENASVILNEPTELELAKQLLKIDDVLDSVLQEFLPNRICEYLFELSQKFNQFYEVCPVLSAPVPTRTSRLILCDLTARAIQVGMTCLGIQLPERM